MTPHPARLVESIFLDVVDLPPDQRKAALDVRCGKDPQLRIRVERLLESDALNAADPTLGDCVVEFHRDPIPVRIGVYLVRAIAGEGGMGAVYDAIHEPTGRRAAVKLVRSGISTLRGRERMRIEAETLGRLNSPNIAQVYDAGVAEVTYPDGVRSHRPFIAMEFVDGVSIVEYAAKKRPTLREKLELFRTIATAIQHAHQRGVIHRDLKPGNILVTGDGLPKVVDFGIARLIDLTGDGITMTGHVLGTIRYMSPEQAAGDPGKVDTRTDIYSMGAILYELLAGAPVIDPEAGSSLAAMVRVMNQEPARLSTINPQTAGDVEAIVHRALERDVADRYQSSQSLADDLQKYLDGREVSARAPTTFERWGRSIRRHKALTTAIVVAVLAVVAGGIVSTWQARVAIGQRKAADDQRRIAVDQKQAAVKALDETEASLTYLTDVLASCTPEHGGRDARVLDVAMKAAVDVETRFKDRPLALTNIELALGRTLMSLGKSELALKQTESAYVTRLNLLGPDDQRTVEGEQARNEAAITFGRGHELGLDYEGPPAWFLKHFGPDDRRTLQSNLVLAESRSLFRTGGPTIDLVRQSARACERLFGPDDDQTIDANITLAYWLIDRGGDPAAAVKLLEPMSESVSRKYGPANYRTLKCIGMLARAERSIGRNDKAVELLEPRINDFGTVFGHDHPDTVIAEWSLAAAYVHLGMADKVEPAYDLAIKDSLVAFGPDDGRTGTLEVRLADWWIDRGRLDDADRVTRDVLDTEMKGRVAIPHLGTALYVRGRVLLARHRPADALVCLDGALSAYLLIYPNEHQLHPAVVETLKELGRCYIDLDRPGDAMVYLQSVVDSEQSNPTVDKVTLDSDRRVLETARMAHTAVAGDLPKVIWPADLTTASDDLHIALGRIDRQEGDIDEARYWERLVIPKTPATKPSH